MKKKKKASHRPSICELDTNFRKLVGKMQPAEITMNLEKNRIIKFTVYQQYSDNCVKIIKYSIFR